ncbi:tetratricopeptide repeat protein [Streptomyces sp. BI20]|uniref:tetratricopeptide repeat protein n=1 Tax=Streptomyces sp. BI20 TaxID=3403460 RepID=UPI003C717894
MPHREPNGQLRTLLADARWSGQNFARAVNAVGAEAGLTLRYDRTSVAHWLAGTRPPAHVVAVVAEALARRIGRRITPADTGLIRPRPTRPAPPAPLPAVPEPGARAGAAPATRPAPEAGPGSPVEHSPGLRLLGSLSTPTEDAARPARPARRARPRVPAVYSSAWRPPVDLDRPEHPELFPDPGRDRPAPGAPTPPRARIGPEHVQAIDAVLPVFRNADGMFGSGLARPALIRYLATTVSPWLRAEAQPAVRHRLLGATGRLAYTAGFLCFDSNRHGTAQDYYRVALRLGQEAGDPQVYAPVLRAMSVQAHHLGHHRQSLELAEAAARESARLPAIMAAFVTGQLAVAEAGCGDRRTALTHLSTAQRLLERSAGQSSAIGEYHQAALAHQQAEALAALGDTPGAVTALAASLRHRPDTERRAQAVTRARLAELLLDQGHVERACATWHELLDLVPHVESARVEDALRRMRGRLHSVRGNRTVHALLVRAAAELRPAPGRG